MDSNSRRIAGNTLYLYIRMAILMLVSLYTSRVVLDQLGVEDYGIYNVVNGLAISFAFFESAFTNATQRFMTVAIGNNNIEEGRKVFNQHLLVYLIIALLIVLLGETLGVWFIKNKMVIPLNRLNQAVEVFHFCLLSVSISLIGIVFMSTLISHENMKIYSYMGVIEGVLKLLLAYALMIQPFDKLVTYAFLMALTTFSIKSFYAIYCYKKYEECRFQLFWDWKLIKHSFSFISWNLLSTARIAINDQGINLLINLFFGPAVNAARGITTQVSGAIYSFVNGFLTATQPQIVKSYVREEYAYLNNLFINTSKYAFYLLFIFVCPVFFCLEPLLTIWLGTIPEWTIPFTQISLVSGLVNVLYAPVWSIVVASGSLKKYALITNLYSLSLFPVVYIILKLGGAPVSVYICSFVLNIGTVILNLWLLKEYFKYSVKEYIIRVVFPLFFVVALSSVLSFCLVSFLPLKNGFSNTILTCILILMICLSVIWLIGLSKNDKEIVINLIHKKIFNK